MLLSAKLNPSPLLLAAHLITLPTHPAVQITTNYVWATTITIIKIPNFCSYVQQMNEKLQWTSTMDFNFITTYVDWKQTKKWDNHKTDDQNYDMLATYLREHFEMQVTGGQCQSRLYRCKKKWNVFSNLHGLSSKPETRIGWDEESNCFTSSDEYWAQMEAICDYIFAFLSSAHPPFVYPTCST
ncbi:uncharacterized protein LOC113749652 [Coffea eugenioides]|uniref:uncharacterized protein LOC113749652 n=1 Tax=Coffea eugenioides TaxID=49369 RepID=UPI000F607FD7|nr:uncharacterized protein LOC113749652 [Coffea eugenioides]